jgi:quercetin dioxygenase-like cupin family protein
MPFGHIDDVDLLKVSNPQAHETFMKVLVGPQQGWNDHVLRVFTIEANGFTPKHQHDWPQINLVLEGTGTLLVDGKLESIYPGHYAFIAANTLHQFIASSDSALKFVCIVPVRGHIL